MHLRHGVTHDVLACWPAGSAWTARPSHGRSARCGHCSPSEDAQSAPTCGCEPWPRSLTISARRGSSASSTAPRSVSGGRPSAARTGTNSSPARTSRTPSTPWCSPTGTGGCCSCSARIPDAGGHKAPGRRPGPGRARTSRT
ncbi:hypothetical protein [Streptomyces sp. NBC_00385]|uniref:hypothetical protein n=1 Tax=Streptomyces sp. NBC_00385 TaxID=2975733 RepID=UPI003FA3C95D